MKKIFILYVLLVTTLFCNAGQWTNYPVATTLAGTETFLFGTATNNQLIVATNMASQLAAIGSYVTNGEYSGNAATFTRNNGRLMVISPREITITDTNDSLGNASLYLDSGVNYAGKLDLVSSNGSVYLSSRNGSGTFSGSVTASNFIGNGTGITNILHLTTSTATSGTVTAVTNYQSETIYLSNSSTISSITIALPTTTIIGQIFRIHSKAAVTTLSVTGSSFADSAVTSLTAGQTIGYQAQNASGAYIRIQ